MIQYDDEDLHMVVAIREGETYVFNCSHKDINRLPNTLFNYARSTELNFTKDDAMKIIDDLELKGVMNYRLENDDV